MATMTSPIPNVTRLAKPTDWASPSMYVTEDQYSTAVIIILSGLVIVGIVFTLCGLFMKAEAHSKTDRDNGLLDAESPFGNIAMGMSMDTSGEVS